jgi:hypothetical protein
MNITFKEAVDLILRAHIARVENEGHRPEVWVAPMTDVITLGWTDDEVGDYRVEAFPKDNPHSPQRSKCANFGGLRW